MKIQKAKILNQDVVQIYIAKKEESNDEIKQKIEKLKKENKNIVIFVSGKEDAPSTLQYIINKQAMQIE